MLVVPVMVPEQASVVVGAVGVTEHLPVTSASVGTNSRCGIVYNDVLIGCYYLTVTIIKTPSNYGSALSGNLGIQCWWSTCDGA